MFNISEIEAAFFNYDSEGEIPDEAWQKRRKEWAMFREYLNEEVSRQSHKSEELQK